MIHVSALQTLQGRVPYEHASHSNAWATVELEASIDTDIERNRFCETVQGTDCHPVETLVVGFL